MPTPKNGRPRVMVIGPGWRFTSGMSYYTCRLTNAFANVTPTRALLIRGLIPRLLYPGRARVGQPVNDLDYAETVKVYDGVDWYWGSSMRHARRFLLENPPDVVVLQWWTGAVLHSYLRLARLAQRTGSRVVIEWHEVQDTGEARIPGLVRYVTTAMRALLKSVDGHVVHSAYDLELLRRTYHLPNDRLVVAPHGPYDHHVSQPAQSMGSAEPAPTCYQRTASDDFIFLYFGIIRPYKGLEDLVAAFELLPEGVRSSSRLVIVGETWEGWNAPLDAVAVSPHRDRITVINRYVTDAEVAAHFASADAVVLPYRRASSSGPLHIAMSAGLPVVVSRVGGLVEAAGDYPGTRFTAPADPVALAAAMAEMPALRGQRFSDPHSWAATISAYSTLFQRIGTGSVLPAVPQLSPPTRRPADDAEVVSKGQQHLYSRSEAESSTRLTPYGQEMISVVQAGVAP